jgi:hypothetical protein
MSNLSALIAWAERLEQTPLGVAIGESRYLFPVIEGMHLIGLSVAVGLLFVTDLRLAGLLLKRIPAVVVLKQLRPWVLGGFAVILISGGLLFVAEASSVVTNPAFAFKLLFIAIAAANAAYFEFVIARRPGVLETTAEPPPRSVRYAGLASLTLWALVIVCGRLIPYLPSHV